MHGAGFIWGCGRDMRFSGGSVHVCKFPDMYAAAINKARCCMHEETVLGLGVARNFGPCSGGYSGLKIIDV